MNFENFSVLVDKIAEFSSEAVISLSLWGEATLHPQFDLFIEKILSYSGLSLLIELSQLNLSDEKLQKISEIVKNSPERTNGKEKIYWIVSVDACNQASYEKIHGNSSCFEDVCAGVLKLSSLFENCVYPQFMRLQENEDSLETFYRFWKEKNDGKLIIQKYDNFAGYLEDKKTADLTPITRNPCWHLRRDFVILLNGDVSICREELLSGSQGNVFSESLEAIWQKRKSFLEEYVKGNLTSLCEKCDEYYTFNF
jgi:spiro-SPASM protein